MLWDVWSSGLMRPWRSPLISGAAALRSPLGSQSSLAEDEWPCGGEGPDACQKPCSWGHSGPSSQPALPVSAVPWLAHSETTKEPPHQSTGSWREKMHDCSKLLAVGWFIWPRYITEVYSWSDPGSSSGPHRPRSWGGEGAIFLRNHCTGYNI